MVDPADLDEVVRRLGPVLGDRMSRTRAERDLHSRDESSFPPVAPDLVAFPRDVEEISAVLSTCNDVGVPVVPFGAGTSLEGHVLPVQGGLCLDTRNLDQVISINDTDLDVHVQAGVTRRALNSALAPRGLFFPVDPGADASIGGMVATGASGTTTVGYGAMRANVLGLTAVLADGSVLRTGGRARKSSAGYDLTRLLIGSEGTLAVVADARLRVYGIPESTVATVAVFPTVDAAVECVIATMQTGVAVVRIELLDQLQIEAVNAFSGTDYRAMPTLFLEFHGSVAGAAAESAAFAALARDFGVVDLSNASLPEQRSALWRARHDAYFAALASRPGARAITTDVCVPISTLARCIRETQEDLAAMPFPVTILGHVGDGNFHVVMVVDPHSDAELAEAHAANDRLVARALDLGGTCTGEHGIGMGKRAFLAREHGDCLPAMRLIRTALDPNGILNPGKVFEPAGA